MTILVAIVACSAWLFAPALANGLFFTSDQAIHVLMAHELHLPEGLFYWGQSRLGSLFPILAYPLVQLFPSHAIWVVSLLQLLLGWSAWWLASRQMTQRPQLILALLWLLPPACFAELQLVGHPYTLQLLLFSLVYYVHSSAGPSSRWFLWRWLLTGFSLGLSVWVSELSLVPIAVTISWLAVHGNGQLRPSGKQVLQLVVASLPGLLLSGVGKWLSPFDGYTSAQTLDLGLVLGRTTERFWLALMGDNGIGMVAYVALGLVVLGAAIFYLRQPWASLKYAALPLALTMSGLFIAVVFNPWTQANDMSPRYHSLLYALVAWVLCAAWTQWPSWKRWGLLALGLVGIYSSAEIGSITGPRRFLQQTSIASTFPTGAIVGEYWSSYAWAATNPSRHYPLVTNGSMNRNPWALERLGTGKDTVTYLSYEPNMPDTLNFAGWPWRKVSASQADGFGVTWASYVPMKQPMLQFTNDKLGHALGSAVQDPSVPGSIAWGSGDSTTAKQGHIVFGTYAALPSGKYVYRFWVKVFPSIAGAYLNLDVNTGYGATLIAEKKVNIQALPASGGYQAVELNFEVTEPFKNTYEGRLYYTGFGLVQVSHVELEQVAMPALKMD